MVSLTTNKSPVKVISLLCSAAQLILLSEQVIQFEESKKAWKIFSSQGQGLKVK
jgi:hypothetical protein